MTTIKTYKCWWENCITNKSERRLEEGELIEVLEEKGHKDFRCPYCSSIIICEVKK